MNEDELLEQTADPATALRLAQEREDLERVMSEQWGRRFVWRLLEEAGVFQLSWTGELGSTAFNEGRRNAGLRLMAELLEYCPALYSRMQRENT